jgi:hypothetical protein
MRVQALERGLVVRVERSDHIAGQLLVLFGCSRSCRWRTLDAHGCERVLQRDPTFVSIFLRQCVLHVAQHGIRRRGGPGAFESRARVGLTGPQRLEPALRFFPEVVERGRGRDRAGHRNLPSVASSESRVLPGVRLVSGRKKVRVAREPD